MPFTPSNIAGGTRQHVLAPERLGDDHAPSSVNAMNLKNMLGQIEANGRDGRQICDRLSHGRRSFRGLLDDLAQLSIEPDAGAGGRGRDDHYWSPPAQIPACGATARRAPTSDV